MKTLSVPKLELQAAPLAARLSYQVKQALTLNITRTFLWTEHRGPVAQLFQETADFRRK